MADRLDRYRSKRDFATTPEPGGDAPAAEEALNRFVVHEHHARRLHWDLRLERDGVLVSWAVPKGIPPDPAKNHLAVHTEDHPLEYIEFSGDIPAGQYGAGTMKIWDRGTYETHKFRDKEVMITFHGERLHGRYVLFRTRGDDWMIHRMDPPEDPEREPMPERLQPMLARTGTLPRASDSGDEASGRGRGGWAYEIKWDGVRAIGYVDGGRLRLESRNGNDITPRYPELRGLGPELGSRDAILDGEVVAFDAGRPSFQKLQGRMHLTSEHAVRRLSQSEPVVYMIFDLLWLEGHSLMELTYEERRARLAELGLSGPTWQTPANHVGNGAGLLEASRAQGLEGIIAKRLDGTYVPGRRSQGWLKVKNVRNADVVVGGWLPGKEGRSGRLGALVVGFYEDGELRYAGRVGSGFSEAELTRVGTLLDGLARADSPFTGRQPPKETRFVEPRLVSVVDYSEVTNTKTLRQPSYKGLRDDIAPEDVGPPEEG